MIYATIEKNDTGNWVQGRDDGGLCCAMGWDRLETLLKESGHIKPGEQVKKFTVSDHGVKYHIEKTDE